MFKLLQALLLILPVFALSACHEEAWEPEPEDPDSFLITHVPDGGASFGTFNQFEHDYASRDIETRSDKDGFTFTLAERSTVIITVTSTSSLDPWLDLYTGGFSLLTGDDNGGPGFDPVLVVELNAGSYVAVVGGVGSSKGSYDFDIVVGSLGGVDFGILSPNTLYFDNGGYIDDPTDFDCYLFTLTSARLMDFELIRLSGSYDGNIQLVDQMGQEVVFNDPAGMADPGVFSLSLQPGTYMLVVGAGTGSGAYRVEMRTH